MQTKEPTGNNLTPQQEAGVPNIQLYGTLSKPLSTTPTKVHALWTNPLLPSIRRRYQKSSTRNQRHHERNPEKTADDRRRRRGRTKRIRIRKQLTFKLRQPRLLTADLTIAQPTGQTERQRTNHNSRTEAIH